MLFCNPISSLFSGVFKWREIIEFLESLRGCGWRFGTSLNLIPLWALVSKVLCNCKLGRCNSFGSEPFSVDVGSSSMFLFTVYSFFYTLVHSFISYKSQISYK